MTSDQYLRLLQDLAQVASVPNGAELLEHGMLKLGDLDALLTHHPDYDEQLLQVRMRLGELPPDADLGRAILETNYEMGSGGGCVFSLYPASDDVVVTLRHRLEDATTAQQLWKALTDFSNAMSLVWQKLIDDTLASSSTMQDFGAESAHA